MVGSSCPRNIFLTTADLKHFWHFAITFFSVFLLGVICLGRFLERFWQQDWVLGGGNDFFSYQGDKGMEQYMISHHLSFVGPGLGSVVFRQVRKL